MTLKIKNTNTLLVSLAVFILIGIGIFARLKGLGKWPLALDEYYIIKSVENILKHGLPEFTNGGYYERGLLMQYLIAPLLGIGTKPELAGRIISVIFNLLAMPAVYSIAKRIGNQTIAIMSILIFSLSIWEIEYARFARMYAPFQTVFLWYLYFALKDYLAKDMLNYKWLIFLSILSIFIYEGSIFLATLNFIPFILNKKIKLNYFLIALIVLLVSIFFNKFNFFTLNSAQPFPQEYLLTISKKTAGYPIKMPKILLPFSFLNGYSFFITILIILFTFTFIWKMVKNFKPFDINTTIALILLGILAILNQFGLFLLLFLIFILWHIIKPEFINKRNIIHLGIIFLINLLYWYIYGISSKDWYTLFDDFSSFTLWGVSKRILVGFFSFPDNYLYLLNYFNTLPFLTIISCIFILLFLLLIILKINQNQSVHYLLGLVIFSALLTTLPKVIYVETRYTFFIVPVLVIIVLYVFYFLLSSYIVRKITVQYIFVILASFIFVISEDFKFAHLFNVDTQEVNYRINYNNYLKRHLYRRWDIKTPTDYVKMNLNKGDLIMINENSMEYYLPRVDFFNFDYKHHAFVALSVEKGKKERWSNACLIYTNEDLINFIENSETTIWFLVFPEMWLYDIDFNNRYQYYLINTGIDGLIKVFKFPGKNK